MKETEKYLVTQQTIWLKSRKEPFLLLHNYVVISFDVYVDETSLLLTVEPIGEKADLDLEGSKTFITQPSSQLQVVLPLEKINSNHLENIGIIQLVDLQGNPVLPKFNVKSKIISSNDNVVQILDDSIIPIGLSYATFSIKTTGSVGGSIISAMAKGVNGTSLMIKTAFSQTQLQIFTGDLSEEFL